MKFLSTLSIIFICISGFSQTWLNYTYSGYISDVLIDEPFIWVAVLDGGVIRFNPSTGEKLFFNKSNTPLNSNFVYRIQKAPDETIWIGTVEGGIVTIKNGIWSNLDDLGIALSKATILDFGFDLEGNTWAGALGEGLIKINNDQWEIFNKDNSPLLNAGVFSFFIDPSDNKWVGTAEDGLIQIQNDDWTFFNTSNSPLERNTVLDIDFVEGQLWVANSNGGLIRKENDSWTIFDASNTGLPIQKTWRVECIGKDDVWFSGSPGNSNFGGNLVHYKNGNFDIINPPLDNASASVISSITNDENGGVWVGTFYGEGLWHYDGIDWTKRSISNCILPDRHVKSIAIDKNNNKWIGTENGISKYDGQIWTPYTHINDDWQIGIVNDLQVAPDGSIWLGTPKGLLKFNQGNWTVFNSNNSPMPGSQVYSITISPDGTVWAYLQNSHLIKFDGLDWEIFTPPFEGMTNLSSIQADHEGNLYAGGWSFPFSQNKATLLKYDGINWQRYDYTFANSMLSPYIISSITIDEENNVYMSIQTDGLLVFDGTSFLRIPAPYAQNVYDMAIDSSGILWMANYTIGLFSFDGESFERFHKHNSGLSSDYVTSVVIDEFGEVWVGNEQTGVDVFRPPYVTSVLNIPKPEEINFKIYPPTPNPFSDLIRLEYELFQRQEIEISLFDLTGKKLLYIPSTQKSKGKHTQHLDGTLLSKGGYFIQVNNGQMHQAVKILKQ